MGLDGGVLLRPEVFVRMDCLAERGELRVPHCGQEWRVRHVPPMPGKGDWPWIDWDPCETMQALRT